MATPGTRVNALDLIKSSLRLLNVLDAEIGENPSSSMAQDALSTLNQMLDAWNAERLMIFTLTKNVFDVVPGQQTYTCGPGANFDMPRPSKIEMAYIISLNNPAQPLELLMDMYTDQQWASIPVKNITSTLPTTFYDDGAFPFRNLSYYPLPSATTQTALWSWTSLSLCQNLQTILAFPPGYQEAFRFNLAPRLAPEYGVQTPIEVAAYAVESKARLKSMNIPLINLRSDPAVLGEGGYYNWLDDQPIGGGGTF